MLIFLVLVGATYQGVRTALERRQYPRPGHMVDVGGHQLHIYCVSKGSPPVVLEAPAAGMSAAWRWVQPQVARVTRVCSYDRAGLGWSDARDGPFDAIVVVDELHRVLANSGEHGPFIGVGHGLGAAFATIFASRFAGDTAALVLINPPVARNEQPDPNPLIRFPRFWAWLARAGILRGTGTISRMAAGLPPPAGGALAAFLNRPDHLTRSADELSHWDDVIGLAATASLNLDMPVVRVDVAGSQRVAFLTGESEAAPVVAAILNAVGDARRNR